MTLPLGTEKVGLFDVDYFVFDGNSVSVYVIGRNAPVTLIGNQAAQFCRCLSWKHGRPSEEFNGEETRVARRDHQFG